MVDRAKSCIVFLQISRDLFLNICSGGLPTTTNLWWTEQKVALFFFKLVEILNLKLDRLPLLGKRLFQMGVESKEKDMRLGFSVLGFLA